MISYESTEQSERNDVVVYDVEFHGRTLKTLEFNGEKWVAVRPAAEGMGLHWEPQRKKLEAAQPQFSCRHMAATGSDGKTYRMLCIPLRKYHSWLTTINPNKVPDLEVRSRIVLFQEASAEVLYQFWTTGCADKDSVFTERLMDQFTDRMETIAKSQATDIALAARQSEAFLKNFFEGAINAVGRGLISAVKKEVNNIVTGFENRIIGLERQIDDFRSFSKKRFERAYNRDMEGRSALDEIARKIDALPSVDLSRSYRTPAGARPYHALSMHEALVSLGVTPGTVKRGLVRSMTHRAKDWFADHNYAVYPQGRGMPVYYYDQDGIDPWWIAQGKELCESYLRRRHQNNPLKRVVLLAPHAEQTSL